MDSEGKGSGDGWIVRGRIVREDSEGENSGGWIVRGRVVVGRVVGG